MMSQIGTNSPIRAERAGGLLLNHLTLVLEVNGVERYVVQQKHRFAQLVHHRNHWTTFLCVGDLITRSLNGAKCVKFNFTTPSMSIVSRTKDFLRRMIHFMYYGMQVPPRRPHASSMVLGVSFSQFL